MYMKHMYFSHLSLLSFQQHEVSEVTESNEELQREIHKLELSMEDKEEVKIFLYTNCTCTYMFTMNLIHCRQGGGQVNVCIIRIFKVVLVFETVTTCTTCTSCTNSYLLL